MERYRQENRGYEHELRSLGQTLHTIDQRQRQLLDNLAHLLQSPSLIDQSESPNKKRRMLALHYFKDEAMLIEDNPSPSSPPLLDLKQVEKLDSSLTFWEKFIHEIDQIPSDSPSSSPMESDINNIIPGSPCSASSAYIKSPAISSIRIDPDSRPSGVDINISPAKTPDARSAEARHGSQSVPANDVFWQQFLTEAPVQPDPSRFAEEHKPWWIVDGLNQHMIHLTEGERI